MRYDPDKHHRRSIRLHGYDYAQAGAYFVTICTQNRECLFGDIEDGEMRLNDYGRVVEEEWLRTATIRREVELDAFIVMPNHVHGIIVINAERRSQANVGATRRVAPTPRPKGPAPNSLGAILVRSNPSLRNGLTHCTTHPAHLCGSATITNTSSATRTI